MIRHPLFSPKKDLSHISSHHFLPKNICSKAFRTGERFRGTIIEVANGGRVTVSAKGNVFNAFSTEPLAKGNVYEFLVSRTWPRVELKVVSRPTPHLSSPLGLWVSTKRGREAFVRVLNDILTLSRAHKGLNKTSITALEKIVDLIHVFHGEKASTLPPERIAGFLLASGLFFESRLRRLVQKAAGNGVEEQVEGDLKGVLLRMIQALDKDGSQGKDASGLYQRLVQLLHLIESHQILNLNAIEADLGWFWFIPFYDGGRWSCAELLTKKISKEAYSIWITMRLSKLGLVQAKIELAARSVRVVFYLDDRGNAELVSTNLTKLKRRFEAQGLVLASFECKNMEEDGMALCLSSSGQRGGFCLEV